MGSGDEKEPEGKVVQVDARVHGAGGLAPHVAPEAGRLRAVGERVARIEDQLRELREQLSSLMARAS